MCNNTLEKLATKSIVDTNTLFQYVHRLLHGLGALLLVEKQSQGLNRQLKEGYDVALSIQGVMTSLVGQTIRLCRAYFFNFPKAIKGPATLGLYECMFSAYSAIIYSTITVGVNASTLRAHGLEMEDVICLLQQSISVIVDYTSKLSCVVLYTQTILSMYSFLEFCAITSTGNFEELYPAILNIRDKCIHMLSEISSRYLLAQLLLDQSALENNKISEPC
jgi:hypothetical protein